MIDPQVSLAFALHSNPGAYAALIGSGVSVGAGIPTGWQVVLDLISKVARVLGEDPGDDLAGWYQERFGEEPDYSKLLDTLAKSPAERSALLRGYFEPTAEERARGVKVPGAAHTALAELAATGHLRLFVTTNFDRLIEQALEAAGVTPRVLSTPDSILGSPPLSQAGCTVLKLHGDYLDTRIKNTPGELDSYDEVVDALLDRIIDEHGFIVCGWSAAWDTALRRAFERSKIRRYTTYWADVVPPGEHASHLIELLHGEFVQVKGADAFFTDMVDKLRSLDDGGGVKTESKTPEIVCIPRTRYAKSGDVHIAFQVFGEGPVDVVMAPGFVSHIENYWTEPRFARWLERLGQGCRVVMFDKRGTGLSDHVNELPAMDDRMDDVRAVMDAVGIERAALFGISEGGSLAALFAASHPERCSALVLYGAFARFSDWFPTDAPLQAFLEYIDSNWGSGESLPRFAPTYAEDQKLKEWWGRFERLGANPAAAMTLIKMNSQIDISHVLPSVRVPTLVLHRTGDTMINIHGGRELARLIPNAKLVELAGRDHIPFVGENAVAIVDQIHEFLIGFKPYDATERTLATVLFTDIVGSTSRAEVLGDEMWLDVMEAHDAIVRRELGRFRGREIKSLGDGFLATFDGPGRAVKCAVAITEAVRHLGIEVRTGLHTGEVELGDDDVRGIAVHMASRVMAQAGPGDVYVTRTVRDLVAGSGINFRGLGQHQLSGFAEQMELYATAK
ncbi:MAG: alpha/beta fold hydrolase [Dehalococcoidia bacterium]